MNRRERRRQEKQARQKAKAAPRMADSTIADVRTAEAFNAALALQQAGRLAAALKNRAAGNIGPG